MNTVCAARLPMQPDDPRTARADTRSTRRGGAPRRERRREGYSPLREFYPGFRSGFPWLTPSQLCRNSAMGFLHSPGTLLQPSPVPDSAVIVHDARSSEEMAIGCKTGRENTGRYRGKPQQQTLSGRNARISADPDSEQFPRNGLRTCVLTQRER